MARTTDQPYKTTRPTTATATPATNGSGSFDEQDRRGEGDQFGDNAGRRENLTTVPDEQVNDRDDSRDNRDDKRGNLNRRDDRGGHEVGENRDERTPHDGDTEQGSRREQPPELSADFDAFAPVLKAWKQVFKSWSELAETMVKAQQDAFASMIGAAMPEHPGVHAGGTAQPARQNAQPGTSPHPSPRPTRYQDRGRLSVASSPAGHTRVDPMLDVAARWRHDPTGEVPGRVRRAVTAQLRTWELRGIEENDVALVLTELVTNAVEHAHTPLTVTVGLRSTTGNGANGGAVGPVVRIEVADGSTAPPRPQPLDRSATRGRGLQMIEALTTGWGYTATATGKTVWAELAPDPGLPTSPDRERVIRRGAVLSRAHQPGDDRAGQRRTGRRPELTHVTRLVPGTVEPGAVLDLAAAGKTDTYPVPCQTSRPRPRPACSP